MKLELKNVGAFEAASIEIDGITVIAGENGSGKSTIGKALYAIFHGLSSFDDKIYGRRLKNICNLLSKMPYEYISDIKKLYGRSELKEFSKDIILNSKKYLDNKSILIDDLIRYYEIADTDTGTVNSYIDEIAKSILESLNLTDNELLISLINESFNKEFNFEINNRYNESAANVNLYVRDKNIDVKIVDDSVIDIINPIKLIKDVVYIDDPYVLDDLNISREGLFAFHTENHRGDLIKKLTNKCIDDIEMIKINNKLKTIFNRLNGISLGQLVLTGSVYKYIDPSTNIDLDVRNIATGLKAFVIVKTLLLNGKLEEKGTIILDEPEIHLHPKWQIILAELIVLIHKVFNMHILLTTHSPYFLRAIEVFSLKHSAKEKTRYYLASRGASVSKIEDVTDDTGKIYKLLAEAFEDLDEVLEVDEV